MIATHELDLALQSADRFWLIDTEGVICHGFPEDLVLNGVVDQVFQLKGFDLKTGKVKINTEFKTDTTVNIKGVSPGLLWTKNAMEREGIGIDKESEIQVEVELEKNQYSWIIIKSEKRIRVFSIQELISFLLKN